MTDATQNPAIDPHAFRRALGNFATGVTIMTATGPDGEKIGVTANSFNSLSLDPPLILWSGAKNSRSCAKFETATHFAVNILASDQMALSNQFAGKSEDKFAGVTWEEGIGGVPIFEGCAGRFQCELYDKFDGGDHWIFVGKVVSFDESGRPPLCFHQGAYSMVFGHPESAPKPDAAAAKAGSKSRMDDHIFFLMLQAVRSYHAAYGPKLDKLELSLNEARTLLALNERAQADAAELVELVNTPLEEIQEALLLLTGRDLIVARSGGHALTDAGLSKAGEIWNVAQAHAELSFQSFSAAELQTFTKVLRGIIGT